MTTTNQQIQQRKYIQKSKGLDTITEYVYRKNGTLMNILNYIIENDTNKILSKRKIHRNTYGTFYITTSYWWLNDKNVKTLPVYDFDNFISIDFTDKDKDRTKNLRQD